ncbi:MAG: type II toxin-antitoxin system VapC family toxin [Bacteroidota bacterium]
MADKKIMVDSTVLIDYFRKIDKDKSRLIKLSTEFNKIYISSVTEFEILNGASAIQIKFWDVILKGITVLDFNSKTARIAADIVAQLKIIRKSIDKPDLFIAATAVANGLVLDTANKKHFVHIESLILRKEL